MENIQALLMFYGKLREDFEELGCLLEEAGSRLAEEGFLPGNGLLEKAWEARENFLRLQKEVAGLENCFLPKDKKFSLEDLGAVVEWLSKV